MWTASRVALAGRRLESMIADPRRFLVYLESLRGDRQVSRRPAGRSSVELAGSLLESGLALMPPAANSYSWQMSRAVQIPLDEITQRKLEAVNLLIAVDLWAYSLIALSNDVFPQDQR